MNKKLVENALSLGVAQIVSMGLPLLALPYLALTLGADEMGRLAFSIAVAQIILVLTDYGFNLSAAREVSIYRDDAKKVAAIWANVTLLRGVFALVGTLLVLVLSTFFKPFTENLDLILVACSMVIGNILFPQWLFQGLERLRTVSLIQIITRFIVFAGIFLLVDSAADVRWAVLCQAGGLLLGGFLAIPYTIKTLGISNISWPSKVGLLDQLRGGWHLFLSTSMTNMYTQGNAMFLGFVAAPAVVAHYYIAERLIRATQLVFGPIGNTIYPHISQMIIKDREGALTFIGKILKFSSAIGLLICIGILLLSPVLVAPLFGHENAAVSSILQVFSLLPLVLIISNILGIQTLLPLGMQSRLSKIYMLAALFNGLVFIPFAYFAGAHGAAFANLLVEMFIVVLMLRSLRQAGIKIHWARGFRSVDIEPRSY